MVCLIAMQGLGKPGVSMGKGGAGSDSRSRHEAPWGARMAYAGGALSAALRCNGSGGACIDGAWQLPYDRATLEDHGARARATVPVILVALDA